LPCRYDFSSDAIRWQGVVPVQRQS